MYEGSALNQGATFIFNQLISLQTFSKHFQTLLKYHSNSI